MQIPGTGELVIGTTPDVPALNNFWGTHVGDSPDGRTGAPYYLRQKNYNFSEAEKHALGEGAEGHQLDRQTKD